jgi:hypothetical protein
MTYFEAEAHSFVMRIWQENRDDPDDPVEWRGWIEHVQSGQRHYFKELTEIPAIVAGYIGDASELDEQVFMPVQPKGSSK